MGYIVFAKKGKRRKGFGDRLKLLFVVGLNNCFVRSKSDWA